MRQLTFKERRARLAVQMLADAAGVTVPFDQIGSVTVEPSPDVLGGTQVTVNYVTASDLPAATVGTLYLGPDDGRSSSVVASSSQAGLASFRGYM